MINESRGRIDYLNIISITKTDLSSCSLQRLSTTKIEIGVRWRSKSLCGLVLRVHTPTGSQISPKRMTNGSKEVKSSILTRLNKQKFTLFCDLYAEISHLHNTCKFDVLSICSINSTHITLPPQLILIFPSYVQSILL